jgi:hypothetical protein
MELVGDMGHVESQFFLFRDSVSVSARSVHGLHKHTISLEIGVVHPMLL